jgi:lipopolysaccharide export system protein LptA
VNALIPTFAVAALAFAVLPPGAAAQPIDLSHGGPISITSVDGIEWRQADHEVIARGDAKAVRGNVTVTADRLIAWYRKKAGAAGQTEQTGQTTQSEQTAQPGQTAQLDQTAQSGQTTQSAQPAQSKQTGMTTESDTAGNEVYRLQAEGNVHIFTPTDMAQGDLATYDIDQAVLVLTGHNLRLTTPNDVLTARDDLEYWSARHMAVARGDAVVVTKDGRRLAADTLVAYTSPTQSTPAGTPSSPAATQVAAKPPDPNADPLTSSGKLEKVEAYGHVSIRTVTDTVTGDRGVYVPDTGIARVLGEVRITRGQNQLAGSEAQVNMKTGISRLLAGNTGRVQGLLVPNDQTNQAMAAPGPPPKPATRSKP